MPPSTVARISAKQSELLSTKSIRKRSQTTSRASSVKPARAAATSQVRARFCPEATAATGVCVDSGIDGQRRASAKAPTAVAAFNPPAARALPRTPSAPSRWVSVSTAPATAPKVFQA
jgi:hypothetical protein